MHLAHCSYKWLAKTYNIINNISKNIYITKHNATHTHTHKEWSNNGRFILKVSIWNLQIKGKNHKIKNVNTVFQKNGVCCKKKKLFYCFSNFVGSPCFYHNSKWKVFQCVIFLCIHAPNQIQMCCEHVLKIVLDEE